MQHGSSSLPHSRCTRGSCSSRPRACPWHHHWASDRMNPARGCDAIGVSVSVFVDRGSGCCCLRICGYRHDLTETGSFTPSKRTRFWKIICRETPADTLYRVSNTKRRLIACLLMKRHSPLTRPVSWRSQHERKEKKESRCGIFRSWQ